MDEILLKQLVRQLKIMNIWISIFGALIFITLAILGVMVYKVVTFVNDTNDKIDSITSQTQETLDFKSKFCDSNNVGDFLRDRTEICK